MNDINLTSELRKAAAYLVSHIKGLNHIDLNLVSFLLDDSNASLRISKIVGRLDVPEGYELDRFQKGKNYLLYFYWPTYFEASKISRLQAMITQLALINTGCRGDFREKEINITLEAALKLLKKKELAIITIKYRKLKSSYNVTADRYELPRFVQN